MVQVSGGRTQILASVSLFRDCSAADLAEIDALIEVRDVRAGETLTCDGEHGSETFIVVSGEAVVGVGDGDGGQLGPGSICGHIAAFDPGYTAVRTVTAVSSMRVLVLPAGKAAALARFPSAWQRITATLSDHRHAEDPPRVTR